jgi:peptidoglycan/LPS O-acetylase OafA/YrhL
MARALRWLLLLFAVGGSAAVAFILTLCFVSAANAFCPADELVSGDVCTARWAPAAYSTGFCIATSIGALLAVFSAYYIAPSAQRLVVWCIVALGAILPFYLVQQRFPDWEFFPALAVAVIAAFILTRHASHRTAHENA